MNLSFRQVWAPTKNHLQTSYATVWSARRPVSHLGVFAALRIYPDKTVYYPKVNWLIRQGESMALHTCWLVFELFHQLIHSRLSWCSQWQAKWLIWAFVAFAWSHRHTQSTPNTPQRFQLQKHQTPTRSQLQFLLLGFLSLDLPSNFVTLEFDCFLTPKFLKAATFQLQFGFLLRLCSYTE